MCGSERVCLCWCVQVRACVDTNIDQAAKERGIAQATELGERGAQQQCHCSQGTWKRPVCSRRCPARSRSGGRSHCALPVRPSCQMPCAHGPVGAFGAICAKSQSPQCSKIARRFRAWFHRTVEMRMWHYEGGTWLGSVAEERPLQPSGCRPDAAQPHRTGLGTMVLLLHFGARVCPPLRCSLVVRVAQGGRAWLCARVVVRKDQGLIRLVRLGPIAPNFPRVLALHSGTHCSVLGATQSGVG